MLAIAVIVFVVYLALLAFALTGDEEKIDAGRFCVAFVVFLLIAASTLGFAFAIWRDLGHTITITYQ